MPAWLWHKHALCMQLVYTERMDTIVVQVRDVPADVIATLRARAEARGQSLSAYLRDLLAREAEAIPIEDVMASIASREPVSYTIEDLRSFVNDSRP
jgi:antitoxin FitA